MSSLAAKQKIRRWVMTGAVTAITISGSIYGAGLKTRQEFKQEKRKIVEATPEEKIAQLETARQGLVTKKNELERKIAEVSARRIAKEHEQAAGK